MFLRCTTVSTRSVDPSLLRHREILETLVRDDGSCPDNTKLLVENLHVDQIVETCILLMTTSACIPVIPGVVRTARLCAH